MGLVTGINLPEDGNTASTSDYNPIINKIIAQVNGNLDDTNILDNGLSVDSLDSTADPAALIGNLTTDFVADGGIWSVSTGLTGTMSEATIVIDGQIYTVSAVASKIFSTSQDTYVDVGINSTLDYTSVGLDAAAPSLAADHVRLARISTDGSDITEIAKTREGGIVQDKLATDAKTVRTVSATSNASLTLDTISYDMAVLTAMGSDTTINAPTGVLSDGQGIMFRFLDDGTSRTLTFNSIFREIGVTKPTATTISKTTYVGCVYNEADSKWDILAVARET